jgi:hypothetical protein
MLLMGSRNVASFPDKHMQSMLQGESKSVKDAVDLCSFS